MKLNEGSCHLVNTGHKSKAIQAKIGQKKMWESKSQKLLKFIIDRQLNFDGYLKSLCKLAGISLGSSARLANFLSSEKKNK